MSRSHLPMPRLVHFFLHGAQALHVLASRRRRFKERQQQEDAEPGVVLPWHLRRRFRDQSRSRG